MQFTAFCETNQPRVEAALRRYLDLPYPDPRAELVSAMQYSVNNGGKRLRPLICLAVSRLFGNVTDAILPLACAIEYIHTYSLIHDDLPAMDNDDFRRGVPTNHKQFGEDIAILAGDTLNTLAFELALTGLAPHYPVNLVMEATIRLAHACGVAGMAGGQVLDIKVPAGIMQRTESYLTTMHRAKTGALLRVCFELPALLEGAGAAQQAALAEFADHLGILFQIVDDILDVEGTSESLGKTPGKDADQNKLTYVTLWGVDGARERARHEADQALACLSALALPDVGLLSDLTAYFLNRNH